ncbi:MAG TPA: beta-ketoacyl-[acyl-carrier-protein] synthase family protein [Chitinivibrionales bacterium]|jgi:3-oxoacyl-(acyl-carrier-protein) synthase|nr:beta-ketoacyl-[acyl-carrier-protein] synthase family protein [Chitinivibrionales bacterium]
MNNNEVCITGMGIVSALGSGVPAHRDALVNVRSGLGPHPFFEGKYRTDIVCGMVPREAFPHSIEETAADRASLLFDMACKEALARAGVHGPCAADIIVGTTASNFHGGTLYYGQKKRGLAPDIRLVSGFLPSAVADFAAEKNRISGRRYTLSSACASAATAIGHAFRLIQSGRASMVCAGGTEALSPFIVAGFNSLRLLSKKACKPFDAGRDGLNPGEGAAVLILESATAAQGRGARPLAYVKGLGEALEAFHHTRSNPDGSGIAAALNTAMARASWAAETMDHVHLHGTATVINDLSEYNALSTVFGDRLGGVPVCSTKSMTGHTLGAAGGVSAVLTVLSLEAGLVPATVFHETIDPQFNGLSVAAVPRRMPLTRAAVTSLGFGGEVACLLLERAAQ